MSVPAFDKLQVLVTGADAEIARDVARMIVGEGGSVVAADKDTRKLARLERDPGLYRTAIEAAQIDLASMAEVRLWEDPLGALGRLPRLAICCCGARSRRPHGTMAIATTQPTDVRMSDQQARDCPALIAQRILQPTPFLHAEPLRHSVFNRTLAVIRHPTLRGVLARSPGRRPSSPVGPIPHVRIASHPYSVRRQADADPSRGRRLRLAPPSGSRTAERTRPEFSRAHQS
jgi:hypothetical protein